MTIVELINKHVPISLYLRDIGHIKDLALPQQISCLLHKDNKPSMRLYYPADKGAFCFSCGKAFDSISIHQEYTGASYRETIQYFLNQYPEIKKELKNVEGSSRQVPQSYKKNLELVKLMQKMHLLIKQEQEKFPDKLVLKERFQSIEKVVYNVYKRKL